MPSFYSGGQQYAGSSTAPLAPSFPEAGGGESEEPAPTIDAGKFTIDLGDFIGSLGGAVGSAVEFGQGVAGGVAGAVGSIGIPGGPNIGDIGELPGGLVDRIGSIGFGDGANVGAVPGLAMDALGASARFVETEIAKGRLQSGGGLTPQAQRYLQMTEEQGEAAYGIPADIQARLDAGESVDALAAEMVEQGRGFSNEPVANLATGILLDPLNLIAPGIGKAARGAKAAGLAVQGGKDAAAIGVSERYIGTAYNAASRGLSAAGGRLMDATIGPATSGVFHAIGSKPYGAIKSGLDKIAPEYATAYEDAFARGAAQLPRAVIARYMADEATAAIRAFGKEALDRLPGDIGATIEARLSAIRTIGRDQIERRTEELLTRTAPDFLGHTPEGLLRESAEKLAAITGGSVEDMTRVLGKVDTKTAQHIHLAFYGKAGDDLARAKALASGSKKIDPEKLTLIAPDTLTAELAEDLLAGKLDLVSAVDQFSLLRNKFGGTVFEHTAVREFVEKLVKEKALSTAVRAPTKGKAKLPPALKTWQRQYEKFGYNIGFAPADGWKTIIDDAGDVIYADPFVHFVSAADPLTVRNPLGRFMDSLLRGATQTTIVADSRARMVKLTRGSGISPNEARALHQKVMQRAADEGVTPRGLSLAGPHVYEDIFEEVLGAERYAEFAAKFDPSFAVMKAFEGNLARVGLTQKFTGKVKTALSGRGNIAAAVTEGIYPKLRFQYSPLFQTQELTESPFFNILRGVRPRNVDPDIAKVYEELADLPDFQYLTEAGYFLHIAGSSEVGRVLGRNTVMGKALSRLPNVKKFKERQRVAQVFHEHGEKFKDAVEQINPAFWRRMVEHYGTSDARMIADAFIAERQALAGGSIDEAMAVFDSAKPVIDGHDMETVWQAFRESFRQSSEQAFKTHYFNPTRGFLERTVNHPYLGLYPASYMWGKVLPEFARFLLKRPFGLNAPLVGLEAYNRVQQAVISRIALDAEFEKTLDENKDLIYLVEQLLPGTPGNLPANLPAWARHLAEDQNAGRKLDPQKFVEREVADTFTYAAGPVRSLNVASRALGDLGDIAGDLHASLTKSAAEYDTFVLPPR